MTPNLFSPCTECQFQHCCSRCAYRLSKTKMREAYVEMRKLLGAGAVTAIYDGQVWDDVNSKEWDSWWKENT